MLKPLVTQTNSLLYILKSPAKFLGCKSIRHLISRHHSKLLKYLGQQHVAAINRNLFTRECIVNQRRWSGTIDKIDNHDFIVQCLKIEWDFIAVAADGCSIHHDVVAAGVKTRQRKVGQAEKFRGVLSTF